MEVFTCAVDRKDESKTIISTVNLTGEKFFMSMILYYSEFNVRI